MAKHDRTISRSTDGVTAASDTPASSPEPGVAHPVGRRFTRRSLARSRGENRVFRAWDAQFEQWVALKATPADARVDQGQTSLEVRVPHPGVVRPICRWVEDRWRYLAMEWIEGGTLDTVLDAIYGGHRAVELTLPRGGVEQAPPAGVVIDLDVRDAIRIVHQAALAVAAAHRHGVVHLDLKPDNIMFQMVDTGRDSALREEWRFWHDDLDQTMGREPPARVPRVRVIDWGISREQGARDTWPDDVPGVPAYMAPERTLNGPGATEPTADVYALGMLLLHVLTGMRPRPRPSDQTEAEGGSTAAELPEAWAEYRSLIEDTTALDPAERPADAGVFAARLRHARSLTLRRRAADFYVEASRLRETAAEKRRRAAVALMRLDETDYNPVAPRLDSWASEDRSETLEHDAAEREAQWLRILRSIQAMDPDCAEVTADLLGWRSEHLRALNRADDVGQARVQAALLEGELLRAADRFGAHAPPGLAEAMSRCREALARTSSISLSTLPSARIGITPLYRVHRRWVLREDAFRQIGTGGLVRHIEPAGRYMLRIEADGHLPVQLPIRTTPGEVWCHARADGALETIGLPRPGDLGADDIYIPAGRAWLGGDPHSHDSPRTGRWVWIGGFVIRRHPVTHGEWLTFVNDLVDAGRGDEARACLPEPPPPDDPTRPDYRIDGAGRFTLVIGPKAHLAPPAVARWPVGAIDWFAARAYCRWYEAECERAGRPTGWRLPSEWEFEKVARLSDQRILHWGQHREPRFTRVAGSTLEQYTPCAVDADTLDETPRGIRWLAGNMRTWCLETFAFDAPDAHLDIAGVVAASEQPADLRMLRGAAFNTPAGDMSGAARYAAPPDHRPDSAGLRLVRTLEPVSTPAPMPEEAVHAPDGL